MVSPIFFKRGIFAGEEECRISKIREKDCAGDMYDLIDLQNSGLIRVKIQCNDNRDQSVQELTNKLKSEYGIESISFLRTFNKH